MNILIYCPDPDVRQAISLHLIELGNYQPLFAETEKLVVSIALLNEIHLVILFDPAHGRSLIDLKDFLREKRRRMRVRLLPDKRGVLMAGWRDVITDALRPTKKRREKPLRAHPRFSWKPQG